MPADGPANPAHALLLAMVLALAGCVAAPPPDSDAPVLAAGAHLTHRAVFIGESNQALAGTVSLFRPDTGAVIVFDAGFRLDGRDASAVVVTLGSDGIRQDAVVGPLKQARGRQAYLVPGHLAIDAYNEVWLWDAVADQPLGLARLTPQ